jgi:hypothetical protein
VLRAGLHGAHSFVRPARRPGLAAPATATFIVEYNGFTPQAQAAFQTAVDIWAAELTSSEPIVIKARFQALGDGVLGAAGPNQYFRLQPSNLVYPIALANKIVGEDFSNERDDWYFGTDGNTPGDQYDFVSVVLHELGHGLGFLSSASILSGQGHYGFNVGGLRIPSVYDAGITDSTGARLSDVSRYSNPSAALAVLYQSGALFFNGPRALAANNGQPVRLYAPNPWQAGSSISHLDETVYAAGDPNSLMTPQLGQSEAIHDPGAITRGIFADLGWTLSGNPATATPTRTATSTPTSTQSTIPIGSSTPTASATPTATRTLNPTEIAERRWVYLPWTSSQVSP